ncbi:MAG: hypothetical protein ACYDH9_25545 [Limisphaerales bacterium]
MSMMVSERLRFGVLGAARITPMALIRPARLVPEVSVVAVASRARVRAEAFPQACNPPAVGLECRR